MVQQLTIFDVLPKIAFAVGDTVEDYYYLQEHVGLRGCGEVYAVDG